MVKTLTAANQSERDKLKIPRSVQQSIPIKAVYPDGIWTVGRKHSRSWKLTDVNYVAASPEAQRSIITAYCGAINTMPTDATTKITVVNNRLNPVEFQRRMLLGYTGDWMDHYREEANGIVLGKCSKSNNLVQQRFVTMSIAQRKIEESRRYFRRVEGNLSKSFSRLDSGLLPIGNYERLRVLHDFFRPGREQYFRYDDAWAMRTGKDLRELICPDSFNFKKSYFEMGDKFGRVLFLREYPAFLADDLISDLTEFARSMVLSIDIISYNANENTTMNTGYELTMFCQVPYGIVIKISIIVAGGAPRSLQKKSLSSVTLLHWCNGISKAVV